MENKINIAELLKDAPNETKLYSPLHGEVRLFKSTEYLKHVPFPIVAKSNGSMVTFNEYGLPAGFSNSECMLFPSKDCLTWENFKAPWLHKHFEPFQKVLINVSGVWRPDIYSYYSDYPNHREGHVALGMDKIVSDDVILPYCGNEDKLGKEVEA